MTKNDEKVVDIKDRQAKAKGKSGKPSKPKRAVSLGLRTVLVTNLNFSPELAGDKLVERVDLSLEVLLEKEDVPGIVLTRGNPLQVLWDKNGEPQLRELGKLSLDLLIEGKARFGAAAADSDDMLEFEPAILKKCSIEPMLAFKATMRCQVRVDPKGYLEDLAELVIDKKCAFSFTGQGATESDGEPQGDLAV